MDLDEAKALVLHHLEEHGEAKNSELMAVCGIERELYDLVREDLLYHGLARDKSTAGLARKRASSANLAYSPAELVISYRHDDMDLVGEIVRHLRGCGVTVFWDEEGVLLGDDWMETFDVAMDGAKVLCIFCCEHSLESEDVRREIRSAAAFHKALLPIRLDPTPYPPGIHGYLSGLSRVDIKDPSDIRWLSQLLSTLEQKYELRPVAGTRPPSLPPAALAVLAAHHRAPPRTAPPPRVSSAGDARGAGRRIRTYLSSTFGDLEAERNALARHVFPKLRELARRHGWRFEAVDMRWGLTDEAALDQQTMRVRLAEIERCKKISPRPNFMVLLGDRYGWRPLPTEIPADEFDAIGGTMGLDEGMLLDDWYRRDENSVPPAYVLQPRTGRFVDWAEWAPVETQLRAILARAAAASGLGPQKHLEYTASATEHEIVRGVLDAPDADGDVPCFFRTITTERGLRLVDDLPAGDDVAHFVDVLPDGRLDLEAHARLRELKGRLRERLTESVYTYEATWSESIRSDHIGRLPETLDECLELLDSPEGGTLCVDAWKSLAGMMLTEMAGLESPEQDDEIARHREAGRELGEFFVGRDEVLEAIRASISASDLRLIAVVGEPGSGTSAVIAKAAQRAEQDDPTATVIVRFIGVTAASADARSLLDGLCREILDAYGTQDEAVPTEYEELVAAFPDALALATAERPLIVFLDALHQLADEERARSLLWLPGALPKHAHLVVSVVPGACEGALRHKYPEPELLTVTSPSPEEAGKALELWLDRAGRTLQPHQRREMIDKFAPSVGSPLYLRMAFEEARLWPSYADPRDTVLDEGIRGLIGNFLARLERSEGLEGHGSVLVSHCLGYLAASRWGLAEDELVDLLSADDEVLADIRARARYEPTEPRLPDIVWSRLYFDLEPYLTQRIVDGAQLLAFSHRQLAEVATELYLAEGLEQWRHSTLADYFRRIADPDGDAGWRGADPRGFSELPYHLAHAQRLDELFAILTDFRFLERKAAGVGVVERRDAEGNMTPLYTGVDHLVDDLELALAKLGGADTSPRTPLIVTAVDLRDGDGLRIDCPWCNTRNPFEERWRGQDIVCPTCGGPLRINPFVLGHGRSRGSDD